MGNICIIQASSYFINRRQLFIDYKMTNIDIPCSQYIIKLCLLIQMIEEEVVGMATGDMIMTMIIDVPHQGGQPQGDPSLGDEDLPLDNGTTESLC